MGKLLTVKSGVTAVLLPDSKGSGGFRNYASGDQVTVTDAEYAALPAATTNWVTVTTSGLPDPYRKSTAPNAGSYGSATATASGATLVLGTNFVQGPASAVTYPTGWLTVPANNPSTGVVGPTPGSAFTVRVIHKQGAAASTAPTGKNWFAGATTLWPGGTVGAFSPSANAVDLFEFVTFDGGATYYNTLKVLAFA